MYVLWSFSELKKLTGVANIWRMDRDEEHFFPDDARRVFSVEKFLCAVSYKRRIVYQSKPLWRRPS